MFVLINVIFICGMLNKNYLPSNSKASIVVNDQTLTTTHNTGSASILHFNNVNNNDDGSSQFE